MFAPARPQKELFPKDNPARKLIYSECLSFVYKRPGDPRQYIATFRRKPKVYGLPGGNLSLPGIRARELAGARLLSIICRRGNAHHCDKRCKQVGHKYRHVFKRPGPELRQAAGGLLIVERAA